MYMKNKLLVVVVFVMFAYQLGMGWGCLLGAVKDVKDHFLPPTSLPLSMFPTRTPWPTFTATVTLSSLPTTVIPTSGIAEAVMPGLVPTPMDTATPTETLVPTPTQVPIPTPPPTNTPTPVPPTATAVVHQYGWNGKTEYFQQCGVTQIYVYIHDPRGNSRNGVYVKVWADGFAGLLSNPSGIGRPTGECEVSLGDPRDITWKVAVLESGNLDAPIISEVVEIPLEGRFRNGKQTCDIFDGKNPENNGRQGAKIHFRAN